MTKQAAGCCAARLRFAACLQQVPKLLARLETDGVARRDLHFNAGLRISADSFLALLDLKHAETAELDPLSARERVAEAFDDGVDGLSGLHARDFRGLRDFVDDVRLDHGSSEGADYTMVAR